MRHGIQALAVVLFFLAISEAAATAVTYRLVNLGFLPGDEISAAYGINEVGQVVGLSFGGGPGTEAFIWDMPSGMQPISGLRGAFDINSSGQVVGLSTTGTVLIGDLENGFQAIAAGGEIWALNDLGQAVGETGGEAFLWDPVDDLTRLGKLPARAASTAWDINNLGQVVGDSANVGFIWDSQNGMVSLVDPTASIFPVEPRAINDLGQVVGRGSSSVGSDVAFIWDPVSGFFELANLLGGSVSSHALDINNLGQAVGQSERNGPEAVLWDPVDGVLSLNDLVDESGDGWFLDRAEAINDAGWIVGSGSPPIGSTTAFLLIPVPELSTPFLFATGLAALAWRGRRRSAARR